MSEEDNDNRLKVKLDYKLPPAKPGESQQGPIETTANYFDAAVSSAHPQGLEGQMRRIYGRIQRKIDAAADESLEFIELEKAEADFLRVAFEKCKIPASFSKYFTVLEDEVERATKR